MQTWLIVLNPPYGGKCILWIQLRYFSPLCLSRICQGCPLASIMKRNSRSIVHWCTWLLKAARWFAPRGWHYFIIHSLNTTLHLMRHKQQHSCTSRNILHNRHIYFCVSIPGEKRQKCHSDQFHISFKGKSHRDRTFLRHLQVLEVNRRSNNPVLTAYSIIHCSMESCYF